MRASTVMIGLVLLALCAGIAVSQDNETWYSARSRSANLDAVPPVITNPRQGDKSVCLAMPSPTGSILFTRDAVLVVLEPKKVIAKAPLVAGIARGEDYHRLLKAHERELLADRRASGIRKLHVVRISFVDANHAVKIEGIEKQISEACFMIGGAEKPDASGPVFTGVAYRDLWPGVDLVFRADVGKVTCSLQMRSGTDPSLVRMEYQGLAGMAKNDMGEWQMESPAGVSTDERPEVYQRRGGTPSAMWGEFIQDGDSLRLVIRGHEASLPTEARWVSGLMSAVAQGWALDGSRRAAVDSRGDRYLSGTVHWSGDQDPISDCFAAKVGSSGKVGWITLVGGESCDAADAVAVDRHGYVFLSGYTRSKGFPTTADAYRKACNGTQDYFSARLGPSGKSLAYSTYLGAGGGWLGDAPMSKPSKLLAVVVDDVKSEAEIEDLANLGISMTFAMMPYCAKTCTKFIKSKGSTAFLHAPLEALGSVNSRTAEIRIGDSDKQKTALLEGWLAQYPGVTGANNHRGSMATSDPGTMKALLEAVRKRNLVFVDSHTAPVAIAANVGKGLGVPCIQQDIFLDDRSVNVVRAKVLAMAELAERTGYSVCICHVGQPAVPVALRQLIPELRAKGFRFVTVPDLLKSLDGK